MAVEGRFRYAERLAIRILADGMATGAAVQSRLDGLRRQRDLTRVGRALESSLLDRPGSLSTIRQRRLLERRQTRDTGPAGRAG